MPLSPIRSRFPQQAAGFTLVEIAIVMVIVSLVFVGGMASFKGFRDNATYTQANNYLKESRIALLSFALSQGYLPCPDIDDDGEQNTELLTSGKTCTASSGTLPWQDLGLDATPPWSAPITYAINAQAITVVCSDADKSVCFFEDEQSPAFDLKTPPRAGTVGDGNLMVEDSSGEVIADNVIAVLISGGKNARQATADCTTVSADEAENCDGDTEFVMDITRTNSADFFDDQLIWIHANTLKGQMRDAGIL